MHSPIYYITSVEPTAFTDFKDDIIEYIDLKDDTFQLHVPESDYFDLNYDNAGWNPLAYLESNSEHLTLATHQHDKRQSYIEVSLTVKDLHAIVQQETDIQTRYFEIYQTLRQHGFIDYELNDGVFLEEMVEVVGEDAMHFSLKHFNFNSLVGNAIFVDLDEGDDFTPYNLNQALKTYYGNLKYDKRQNNEVVTDDDTITFYVLTDVFGDYHY